MESNVRARLLITGRVQGVAFRWETLQAAQRCRVVGWVRNLPDGRVEAVLEGPSRPVNDLIDWCRQGPPIARVDSLDIQWEDFSGTFEDFQIRP
ncbi:MAG: acylphosphatase [Desulfobacterales bacterium]